MTESINEVMLVRCRDCVFLRMMPEKNVTRKAAESFKFIEENRHDKSWQELFLALKEKGYEYASSESVRTGYLSRKKIATRPFCIRTNNDTEQDGFCAWAVGRDG